MDINSVFAYGSTVSVLIKTCCETTINGVLFHEHEPYTIIKEAIVDFNYGMKNVVGTTRTNNLAENGEFLSNFTIKNVTLTKKISNLLFDAAKSNVMSYYTAISNSSIMLDLNISNIIMYKDNVLYTDFSTAESETNTIVTINNYDSNAKYLVFYDKTASSVYALESPDLPYFDIYIYGKGNKDQETCNVTLHISTAKLMAEKNLNFNSNGGNQVDLYFTVIGKNNSISFE
jgi:hypothetical protein